MLTPAAPPSMRTKPITLEACGISVLGKLLKAPRLSEGKMKPKPMRPKITNTQSRVKPAAGCTKGMRANDEANSAKPRLTKWAGL